MLESTSPRKGDFRSVVHFPRLSTTPAYGFWDELAASAILVLGSPRSGTTWLAKILDSHPDVLYRHEPDEVTLPRADLAPTEQIRLWLRQRSRRSAASRPYFGKSWRAAPLASMRNGMALMLSASERLSIGPYISRTFGLPDLIAIGRRKTIRAALKLVNWDGSTAASTMPDCRCCLILRHPCGQIASTQAGEAGQAVSATGRHRFVREAGLPSDIRRAAAFAASRGVDAAAYEALPNAGKLAWVWRAFNEPLVAGLRNLPNTKIVVYEDLCRNPEAVARNLFAFADLDWSAQTSAFLDSSTNSERDSGYYGVFRPTAVVVDRWRRTMSKPDQEAVHAVVRGSPLAQYWPDQLAAT